MELFVTDLDGTLLNSNKEVSDYSAETLNMLIDKDVNFTVATARTPATVVELLEKINLRLPAVLMNGVLIYDINIIENLQPNTLVYLKCHFTTQGRSFEYSTDGINWNKNLYPHR